MYPSYTRRDRDDYMRNIHNILHTYKFLRNIIYVFRELVRIFVILFGEALFCLKMSQTMCVITVAVTQWSVSL